MRFRDAISGKFVTRLFARLNPRTTVSERGREKPQTTGEMVPCPYCGYPLSVDATFCPRCGTDLLED